MARWAWAVGFGMVVIVVGGLLLFGHLVQERERHIRVGRDTTFVSGPVDAWGYVDYVAGANAEFSKGVTKENNAAGLLVRATGISKEAPGRRTRVLKALGLAEQEVPEKGYVLLGDVMAVRKGEAAWDRQDRVSDEEDRLRTKVWRAEEHAEGAAWVKGNARALGLVKEASLRERYFEPLVDKVGMGCLMDAEIPELGAKRTLANVLAARAMLRLGAGDRAGWRADVMTLQRYGRLLLQGQTLIQRLVGEAVENVAQECAWAGLEGMGAEEAEGMLGELRGLPAAPELAESVDKVERLEALSELSAFAKYGNGFAGAHSGGSAPAAGGAVGDGIVPMSFERWMRTSNRLSDLMVAAMREKTCAGMKAGFAAADAEEARLSHPKGLVVGRAERVAALLVSITYPSFLRAAEIEHAARMQRELTEMGLVLAMDREKRGGYVEGIAELPSEAVRGMDEDFFSGGKLVYRREGKGYVLYSVGMNGRDDGGMRDAAEVHVEAAKRKDDVVLRVGG